MYFTSDTHFNHENIIRYSNRPFQSVNEMNEAMIRNWNQRVRPNDTIYHLGDFAMGDRSKIRGILSRLNGRKILITGNHDKQPSISDGWAQIHDFLELKHDHSLIVMCHYAMRVWNRSHRGTWMLYGHSHGSLPDDPGALSIDVGVDCHDYTPISHADIGRIMAKKTWKPIDHHGR
jgi:calcineurin-like phosphoesterase family protein